MKLMLKSMSISPEEKEIIKDLKNGELEVGDVPEEFALNSNVVRMERALGLRKSENRGFDVITQKFFVEEQWFYKDLSNDMVSESNKITFDTFEKYYNFLDGDVYERACYYQYSFKDEFSKSLNLDIGRLRATKSFVKENIDDYSYSLSEDEISGYYYCEKTNKKFVKQWLDKFNACDTYEKFKKVCNNYGKSTVAQYMSIDFFLFQYIFCEQCDKKHLNIIMEYLSKDYYFSSNVVLGLCMSYEPKDILERYDFLQASATTSRKRKTKVKDFAEELKNGDIETEVRGYFDKITHFYCEKTKVYRYENRQGRKKLDRRNSVDVCRAFETFDEFIKYRKGNLKNCDLSGAIDLNVDFSKYKTDETTKLPIGKNMNLSYKVQKIYENEKFIVKQSWYDEIGKCVKRYSHTFTYFFDFVAFLKGDLSGANLVFCTGMKNLSDLDGINLHDVKMTSKLCRQLNVPYITYDYDKKLIDEFPLIERNEKCTALVLQASRKESPIDNDIFFKDDIRISYISDLHLMHKIKNAKCKSKEDVIYIIQKIIDNILPKMSRITLIGGDVSSEFSVFELFVKMLRKSADKLYGGYEQLLGKRNFIFVLGNHEFWDFPGMSIEEIVKKYRTVLQENGMYLLQNDLFYKNEFDDMGVIPYDELIQLENSAISKKLRCTRLVIFGSLGFSGYNEEFNANNGVYRTTIDRKTEIWESEKFERLYNKLMQVLEKKNTIIFTHMPKKDWCSDANYHNDFVYVSGHTHRNIFFDDGVERIYADNQIGYRNENPHLKSFLMDGEYDYFADYKDGVYEITSQEYQDFSRGKDIDMTFNRRTNILYMLKKSGYYCFIHKTKAGTLSILNGGALKKLDVKDVYYYYDNMDTMINSIKTPLKKYTIYQKSIANEIKKIGGSGRIHGCIIDIDYYNHIYVNPVDMTVTGYRASDIINKLVYPTIPALLEKECPKLYSNYLKMIESEELNPLMGKKTKNEISLLPQEYLETNIYKASREIKKMQKLSSNILTTWYEIVSSTSGLPCK